MIRVSGSRSASRAMRRFCLLVMLIPPAADKSYVHCASGIAGNKTYCRPIAKQNQRVLPCALLCYAISNGQCGGGSSVSCSFLCRLWDGACPLFSFVFYKPTSINSLLGNIQDFDCNRAIVPKHPTKVPPRLRWQLVSPFHAYPPWRRLVLYQWRFWLS